MFYTTGAQKILILNCQYAIILLSNHWTIDSVLLSWNIVNTVIVHYTIHVLSLYFHVITDFIFRYYLLNMERSDTHNIICIFRIFSLWLENRSNIEILKLMNTYLDKIPTYKFISILPQLVPHITSKGDDEFGQQIKNILKRCAKVNFKNM